MNLRTKDCAATALQYLSGREQEQEFLDAIGPGSRFLRTKFEPRGGPNPGKPDLFYLCSGKETWVLSPGDWLVIFQDGDMMVMDDKLISRFFDRSKS